MSRRAVESRHAAFERALVLKLWDEWHRMALEKIAHYRTTPEDENDTIDMRAYEHARLAYHMVTQMAAIADDTPSVAAPIGIALMQLRTFPRPAVTNAIMAQLRDNLRGAPRVVARMRAMR